MMKKSLILFLILHFGLSVQAQNVIIPDANFKACLVGNLDINTNSDTEIQVSEAIAYTGTINCQIQNIGNVTGIEEFINITGLNILVNQVDSIDLSNNVHLTFLECSGNFLTTLDLSANMALTELGCEANQLTDLNLSQNTQLTHVNCAYNQLSLLDISLNSQLEYINCSNTEINVLDLSNKTSLKTVLCVSNELTDLDVSTNTLLEELQCEDNQITSLDLSSNVELEYLRCSQNQLTELNVKNGNNVNVLYFFAFENPDLICIEVDDPIWSADNWTNIDSTAYFSNDCSSPMGIDESHLATQPFLYPSPTNGILFIEGDDFDYSIYNSIGELVLREYYEGQSFINVESLPSGLYFLIKEFDGMTETLKFIKE